MPKTPAKRPKPQTPKLEWRISHIRDWRKHRGDMTLEELADRLSQLKPPIKTTHASLGRIERGRQKPSIDLIEGIGKILDVDIDTMLNRLPSSDDILPIWRLASEEQQSLIVEIARSVVKQEGQQR